jgi:UDP-N-acetylglucosamine--N-acetylmuramyl-(pentapeptide) pyrophosphoryl-undecaprenol N-acetylglucosamine transferase
MKILFSGGGTLGTVMPILSVALVLKKNRSAKIIWIGTKNGPEAKVIKSLGIDFKHIQSGKLRRYFSLYNFLDILKIILAFFQSVLLLKKEKPDLLVSAGGYTSVPLHVVAYFLGIPTWVHQQDARVGLANKIMAKTASKITVALKNTADYFDAKKTEWTGNFCRPFEFMADISISKKIFSIADSEPVIFAVGGSTGAARLNDIVLEALKFLPKNWHVIHVVGQERSANRCFEAMNEYGNYKVYKFLNDEMPHALNIADVVVTRAGFSTLTELSYLEKASIILPISDSHQESNAMIFKNDKSAIVLDERVVKGKDLAESIMALLKNPQELKSIGQKMKITLPIANNDKILEIIDQLIKK